MEVLSEKKRVAELLVLEDETCEKAGAAETVEPQRQAKIGALFFFSQTFITAHSNRIGLSS